MKKSTIHLVSGLKEQLKKFPSMVSNLEKKEPSFMDNLLVWLKASEELLTAYNISDASELAGIRSKIIAPKFSGQKNLSARKIQLKIAADVLYDIQHTTLTVLRPYELKIEECRELVRQLLQIVSQTKAIKYNKKMPFEHLVNGIWEFIISNDQLKAGAVKLKTQLSMTDIQILLAEEINLEDF